MSDAVIDRTRRRSSSGTCVAARRRRSQEVLPVRHLLGGLRAVAGRRAVSAQADDPGPVGAQGPADRRTRPSGCATTAATARRTAPAAPSPARCSARCAARPSSTSPSRLPRVAAGRGRPALLVLAARRRADLRPARPGWADGRRGDRRPGAPLEFANLYPLWLIETFFFSLSGLIVVAFLAGIARFVRALRALGRGRPDPRRPGSRGRGHHDPRAIRQVLGRTRARYSGHLPMFWGFLGLAGVSTVVGFAHHGRRDAHARSPQTQPAEDPGEPERRRGRRGRSCCCWPIG